MPSKPLLRIWPELATEACIFCQYSRLVTSPSARTPRRTYSSRTRSAPNCQSRFFTQSGPAQQRFSTVTSLQKSVEHRSRPSPKFSASPGRYHVSLVKFPKYRNFSITSPRGQQERQKDQASTQKPPSTPSSSSPSKPTYVHPTRPKRPHIRARDGELVPAPLSRPLGLRHAPRPGQNTGIDTRTWREKKADFASFDKHLERRRSLIKGLFEKSYFRDVGNIGKVHQGKSILAPSTPYRRDLALYFPNLRGRTLVKGEKGRGVDTTSILAGKISVVKVLGSQWAQRQCESFTGLKQNPELHSYLSQNGARDAATPQMVEINVEENPLKWWLVRLFMGNIRRNMSESEWAKYFLIRYGVSDEIREALGMWNSKIGYIYLLDGSCRVRWAGNGDAREDEKKSLVNCLKRLVDEARGVQRVVKRQDARPIGKVKPKVEEELEEQAVSAGAS